MNKEWYYLIEGGTKGPLTAEELRREPSFTPDSLVWKEGFPSWIPAREAAELKNIFKDRKEPDPEPCEEDCPPNALDAKGDVVVVSGGGVEPPVFLFFIIVAVLTLTYMIYRLYFNA